MKSINIAQIRASNHITPLIPSSKLVSKFKNRTIGKAQKSKRFLERFGVDDQQFRTVFANLAHSGVVLFKIIYNREKVPIDFIFLDVNPSFEKIFDVKKKNLLLKRGRSFFSKIKVFPLDWQGIFNRVSLTGLPEHCDVCFQSRDKWYQVYAYCPKKGYVISLFIDITRHKKAEQAFVMTGQWFRRLYETTHDGIMARDIQGRIIDCNKAYAKMLGYTKKELKSLSVQQLLPDKWHEQREKIVK